ncbi:Protein CBG14357 [Caenorhabditis briggsae]|uniref:Protein CBG14357 n=1 Tax=Caenorhabditis briggsae TaxID=6238 RepID=A8XJU0_CAEBR|nr:Protein CBG14357 [Caenorhabditis briggsae]CAP32916.2 Protein CBG14357 [Caenorhabditis briggsae]
MSGRFSATTDVRSAVNYDDGYWPFVENRKRLAYFLIAPLVFAFILMSPGLQNFVLPFESFIYARLALLLLPSAISFLLLTVCLVIKKERLNYDPGFSISLSKALVRVLYVFVMIDFVSRLFLFFRLIEDNVDFVVLTGSENGDFVLHTFLNIGLQVSICVYYLAPVYIPIALTLFVKHFRDSVLAADFETAFQNWFNFQIFCCKRINKVHTI